VAVPLDWPDFSSADAAALLAPFLACTSPAEFVALQQQVDMPRLMESLDDWSAVRLGTLGPVREDAAPLLQRKRAAFLLSATERYGLFQAEVFALFVLHSAHDDEVNEVLRLLARDKQLVQTLGHMPAVREELEQRGLSLSRHPARAEQAGDVLRGLGRAAGDALATSPTSDGARYLELSSHRAQLPPPYQQALDEVQRALALRHFSADSVALGSFDHLTFGMPLGCFYLVAGTGQGLASLSQGQYEQATRELAPAMLLGALYVGGKGLRPLSQTRGAPGVALHWKALQERGRQLEARLGVDGLRELARHIQASREAGRFVAVGGVDAALALHEARGNVARAQAWLSKARHEATSSASRGLASLVDAQAGLTPEVVQARLAAVELEAAGPRLPGSVAALEKQRPSVDAPPPGAEGSPRWGEYVAYYERRLGELQEGTASKGPLRWDAYEQMRGWFARGVAFERLMVKVLRADAELPRAQRRFLGDFDRPRIETYVGVKKPGAGLCYADVLVIETDGWARAPPRVETFSFKSRNLSLLDEKALEVQMTADANEALLKYGGTLDIRRSSLQFLFHTGTEASVQRIRLVYEGDMLKPKDVEMLKRALDATEYALPEVEVLFQ
jgi:tetratricopeptide (TPR) repeat protein